MCGGVRPHGGGAERYREYRYWVVPFAAAKPGVVYLRAYYKSATTANPLRVEIRNPTFNLYAPEGSLDFIDGNFRDLYLKCNGRFVCPDVARVSGRSVTIHLCSAFAAENDGQCGEDGLYGNSFGFLELPGSTGETVFDISYKGFLVKEISISPTQTGSRSLSFFCTDADGARVSSLTAGVEYGFGIEYGGVPIPLKTTLKISSADD